MNSSLPIEIVPGNTPPRFRWQHTTSTPVGERTQECEGLAPTSMERALTDLIALAHLYWRELGCATDILRESLEDCAKLQAENQALAAQLMACQDKVKHMNHESEKRVKLDVGSSPVVTAVSNQPPKKEK